jgi:hypothetical protein
VAGSTRHRATAAPQRQPLGSHAVMTILEAHYDPAIDLGLDFDGL